MKANITSKSAFAVAISVLTLSSCVEETLYIIEQEEVKIQNNLVLSEGQIFTGEDAINLRIALAQDTILVEDFSELALTSDEFIFSDSQEASISTDVDGNYVVEEISFRDYEIEEYSINKRRVTVNFAVKYSHYGEKRDTVLSPWYFQETPAVVIPQEPEKVDVVTQSPRFEFKYNENGTVTSTAFVDWFKNEELTATDKLVVSHAKSGSVSGMDVYTPSTACTKADMQCDTVSVTKKVMKDYFTVTTVELLYSWKTSFESTTGGEISPKNEIKLVFVSEIVYEKDGYRHVWTFNASAYDVVRRIEDHGLEGKTIEGTYSPYLGTYVLKVNCYLFSPQVKDMDGRTPFHTSTAENNIYQRESVVS